MAKVITIKWRDSNLYITQTSKEDLEVATIESTGFVIEETEDRLILAGDLVNGEYRRVLVIPRENIINVEIEKDYIKHLLNANDILRSTYQIAEREIKQKCNKTNWKPFIKKLEKELEGQHRILKDFYGVERP